MAENRKVEQKQDTKQAHEWNEDERILLERAAAVHGVTVDELIRRVALEFARDVDRNTGGGYAGREDLSANQTDIHRGIQQR